MIKLVVFDFDGTIADTGALSVEIFQEMSRKHGIPVLSAEEIEEMRKLPIRKRLKLVSVPLRKVPKLMKESWGMMKEKIGSTQPFDGIVDVLNRIQGKVPMVILSSNHADNIHTFLSVHDLNAFDDIIGAAKLFGKEKPLRKLLKTYGLKPSEVLYVGDEIRDIVSTQKLGIPITSVSWGFDAKEALALAEPTILCDTPTELQDAILSRIKKDA